MEQSLVLIGSVKYNDAATYGTGFLISFKSKVFIVTCKHVIYEAGCNNLFAIPNPKMTKSPVGGYKVLPISKLNYHPEDSCNESYDIVICEINQLSDADLKGLSCFEINDCIEPNNGDKIKGYGFPIDYAEKLLNLNKEDRLPPCITYSVVYDIPILQLSQNGFVGKLKEGYFAQTVDNKAAFKGFSGGLLTIGNSEGEKPYGVILGGAEFNSNSVGRVDHYEGVVFAKFHRVLQILYSM